MLKFCSVLFCCIAFNAVTQYTWEWTELENMPFRTANNAVCECIVGGEEYVYSFGGIDTSKLYSGIHSRAFKYHVGSNTWAEIDSLPDPEPKIASAASFVKGKIYIIGGYHVYQGGSEVSSDKVHVYNPQTDIYENDGIPVPLPIDDQVQCVYKDSLIFVVTGWSNNGNKPNVQIYNPALDQWQEGTPVPNNAWFTAFGASGYILGDTLYYHGGASGFSFGARKYMRKGIINPIDPTDISWEQMTDAPGAAGYRSACSGIGNTIFWVGGSPTSYNYNGIAYNGTGGVDPSARILHFNNWDYLFTDNTNEPFGVMDLRGIAALPGNRWIVCGGMDTNQVVSNRTFLLENLFLNTNDKSVKEVVVKYQNDRVVIEFDSETYVELFTSDGRLHRVFSLNKSYSFNSSEFESGIYFLRYNGIATRVYL